VSSWLVTAGAAVASDDAEAMELIITRLVARSSLGLVVM
jgi:hypothetical protein